MVCTYGGILYVKFLNKEEILTPAVTWMNLEDTLLSKTRGTQKDMHCAISLTRRTRRSQVHRDRKWSGGYQRMRKCLIGALLVQEEEKVQKVDGGDGCAPCECSSVWLLPQLFHSLKKKKKSPENEHYKTSVF